MYKIGEFSKMTNLTIKALHYYDDQEVLIPSEKLENNYRLYSESDFNKAKLIVLLKELDFSIAEIKDVINSCNSINDDSIRYFLKQKQDLISERIIKEKKTLKKIEKYLPHKNIKEENFMNYEVLIKEIDSIEVISKRFKGHYSDVSKIICDLYKEAKGNANGSIIDLYYDNDFVETADIETCLPIKNSYNGNVFSSKTLEGDKFISTTHIGSYESIGNAYKALVDYANANNLIMTIPTRLVYKKGPGMILAGNPNKYETEVLIPIK